MVMKERPILFSGEMVRAILDGRKTQTRRVVKSEHDFVATATPEDWARRLASGANFGRTITEGDIQQKAAQVKGRTHPFIDADGLMIGLLCPYGKPGDRLWVRETWGIAGDMPHDPGYVEYRANCQGNFNDVGDFIPRWRPSIHMPRWASRILLEITAVRVERLQDISATDCWAEGIQNSTDVDPSYEYGDLWERIHGSGSWDANPWVWVIEFRRIA